MHEGYLHAWLTTRYPFCWQYIQSAKEHGKKKTNSLKKFKVRVIILVIILIKEMTSPFLLFNLLNRGNSCSTSTFYNGKPCPGYHSPSPVLHLLSAASPWPGHSTTKHTFQPFGTTALDSKTSWHRSHFMKRFWGAPQTFCRRI